MTIKLLLTGGTLDKSYNEIDEILEHTTSHIDEMLKVSRHSCDIKVEEVFLKDSRHMTQEDRDRIAEACKGAEEDRILITHGTTAMTATAQTLVDAGLNSKTIVLTGAMVPFSLGVKSDAMFNLGSALAFVQLLPPGVYIAMNGRYFVADQARKDETNGVFVEQ